MNKVIKNPFERMQKGAVSILCIVCVLFVWSCQNKSENNQPLSDEEISSNLSIDGEIDSEFLIGEWDVVNFAYTADGNKISHVKTISDCTVDIRDGFLVQGEEEFLDHELFAVYFKICLSTYSKLGNIINLIRSDCYAINIPWTDDEIEIKKSLLIAYSFVVKSDELFIYFTGVENKNLLILKKR